MPRTKEQFEKIRIKSRNLIINTALEQFSVNGFHTTSMEKIALAAGISKGLIYNYFRSKDELLQAIIQFGLTEIEKILSPANEKLEPVDILRNEIENMFRAVSSNFVFWEFYFALIMQPGVISTIRQNFNNKLRQIIDYLEILFSSLGIADPKMEARLFGAVLDGIFFHFLLDKDNYPLTEVKQFLIQKYCGGSK